MALKKQYVKAFDEFVGELASRRHPDTVALAQAFLDGCEASHNARVPVRTYFKMHMARLNAFRVISVSYASNKQEGKVECVLTPAPQPPVIVSVKPKLPPPAPAVDVVLPTPSPPYLETPLEVPMEKSAGVYSFSTPQSVSEAEENDEPLPELVEDNECDFAVRAAKLALELCKSVPAPAMPPTLDPSSFDTVVAPDISPPDPMRIAALVHKGSEHACTLCTPCPDTLATGDLLIGDPYCLADPPSHVKGLLNAVPNLMWIGGEFVHYDHILQEGKPAASAFCPYNAPEGVGEVKMLELQTVHRRILRLFALGLCGTSPLFAMNPNVPDDSLLSRSTSMLWANHAAGNGSPGGTDVESELAATTVGVRVIERAFAVGCRTYGEEGYDPQDAGFFARASYALRLGRRSRYDARSNAVRGQYSQDWWLAFGVDWGPNCGWIQEYLQGATSFGYADMACEGYFSGRDYVMDFKDTGNVHSCMMLAGLAGSIYGSGESRTKVEYFETDVGERRAHFSTLPGKYRVTCCVIERVIRPPPPPYDPALHGNGDPPVPAPLHAWVCQGFAVGKGPLAWLLAFHAACTSEVGGTMFGFQFAENVRDFNRWMIGNGTLDDAMPDAKGSPIGYVREFPWSYPIALIGAGWHEIGPRDGGAPAVRSLRVLNFPPRNPGGGDPKRARDAWPGVDQGWQVADQPDESFDNN